MTSVVWFRRDARLDDNPALAAAAEAGPICALFVVDPGLYETCSRRRRDLLVAGLADLDRRIQGQGGRLRVERGDPAEIVPAVAAEHGAGEVHINSEVTPYGLERDRRVAAFVDLVDHDGLYTVPPGSVLTNEGETYKVFTPFHKSWAEHTAPPIDVPENLDFAYVSS